MVFRTLGHSYAQELIGEKYFDFVPRSYLTSIDQTLVVDFLFDLGEVKPSRFKVRPKAENVLLKMVEDAAEKDATLPWTQMPLLGSSQKIKLYGSYEVFGLHFEILDLVTGKIYTTSTYKVWNGLLLSQYIDKINSNLLNDKMLR